MTVLVCARDDEHSPFIQYTAQTRKATVDSKPGYHRKKQKKITVERCL